MAAPFRTAEVQVLSVMRAGAHMELLLYSFIVLRWTPVHFSGKVRDLVLVFVINQRVGCADTNSCGCPLVPRTVGML